MISLQKPSRDHTRVLGTGKVDANRNIARFVGVIPKIGRIPSTLSGAVVAFNQRTGVTVQDAPLGSGCLNTGIGKGHCGHHHDDPP